MYRSVMARAVAVMISGLLCAQQAPRPQDSGQPGAASEKNQSSDSKPKAIPAPAPEAPKKGAVAPDFTLTDLKGGQVKLSDFKGKAVVLNFWATWCGPCKIEMPWLVDLQKQYGPQGLQILGVAMDDADDATIKDFATKMGVNYPVLKGSEKVADLYGGLEGLPATFFVGRSGKISDEAVGLMSKSVIENSIKLALQGGQESSPSTGEK